MTTTTTTPIPIPILILISISHQCLKLKEKASKTRDWACLILVQSRLLAGAAALLFWSLSYYYREIAFTFIFISGNANNVYHTTHANASVIQFVGDFRASCEPSAWQNWTSHVQLFAFIPRRTWEDGVKEVEYVITS